MKTSALLMIGFILGDVIRTIPQLFLIVPALVPASIPGYVLLYLIVNVCRIIANKNANVNSEIKKNRNFIKSH